MELIESKYIVECTLGGEYYAYLADYNQCCAYGETLEEAIYNLKETSDEFFNELNSIYFIEDIS